MANIPILIIAAGASRRLGQPKQLLPYQGTVLVDYVVQEALKCQLGPVFVVLGANSSKIQPHLDIPNEQIFNFPNWSEGMSSSIAFGVQQIAEQCSVGLIISLADQPFLKSEHFTRLVEQHNVTNAPVVISKYSEGKGPPAFFVESTMPELMELSGDDGAKAIVKKYGEMVSIIDFPSGDLDIDEEKDLSLLITKNG